jgi:hypothetical protein
MAGPPARLIVEAASRRKIDCSPVAGQGALASRILECLRELNEGRQWLAERDRREATDRLRREIFGLDHRSLPFPIKLHRLASCDALRPDIFWWEDGKAVAIDRRGYQKRIMGTFFDQHRFKSFQNLIKRYGFQTIQSRYDSVRGEDIIVYSHEFFLQGEEDMAKKIVLSHRRLGLLNDPQRMLAPSKSRQNEDGATTTKSTEIEGDTSNASCQVRSLRPHRVDESVASWEPSYESDADCHSVVSLSVSSVGLESLLNEISAEEEN